MFYALMSLLLLQRGLELLLAERNRRWAIRQGGEEYGRSHYPVIVCMHILFYLCLVIERFEFSRNWSSQWPVWLTILILAQVLRFWAILSLGRLWNTRIIVIPGRQLCSAGPYRFIRHPNYIAVAAELLSVPMLVGSYLTAVIFSVSNLFVLRIRIREEEQALERFAAAGLKEVPRFFPWLSRR